MRNYDSLLPPLIGWDVVCVRFVSLAHPYYVCFVKQRLYFCYLVFVVIYLSVCVKRYTLTTGNDLTGTATLGGICKVDFLIT